MLMVAARILIFLLGVSLVLATLFSAIRTFVLPRSANDRLSRFVFLITRKVFNFIMRWAHTYVLRDSIMAYYAPVSLLILPAVWLALVLAGYMGMFWAIDPTSWPDTFKLSGSSLFTLGFATPNDFLRTLLIFSEAAIGLALLALLISYLPTMYAAFSKREATVTLLEVRAGSPPSAIEMFARYQRLQPPGGTGRNLEVSGRSGLPNWTKAIPRWRRWPSFARPSQNAPGSRRRARCWTPPRWPPPRSTFPEIPRPICAFAPAFWPCAISPTSSRFRYDPHPAPTDPISISREEFDAACEQLASQGVPLKPDRDQCWRDFAGWRVNYDTVLIALASLTMAPEAPWSSDRLTQAEASLATRLSAI